MSKLIPLGQQFVDTRNGEQIGITRIKAATSTSDYVVLPNPIKDARVLGNTEAESNALGFYLGGGAKANIMNIDNATVGTEYVVVSRHGGMVNYGSE